MTVTTLIEAARPPLPFEASPSSLWTDPWIAQRMLAAHLDDRTDAASRAPAQREAALAWIEGLLGPGTSTILDLGCGPGLYAEALAAKGHAVTGIDISSSSIAHARESSGRAGHSIDYRLGDYRSVPLAPAAGGEGGWDGYSLAMMVYCDLGALNPADSAFVLDRVRSVLAPGCLFVFDVFGEGMAASRKAGREWYSSPGPGFWSPLPHVVLESTHLFVEEACVGSQSVVWAEGREPAIYRSWDRWFSEESLEELLASHGFQAEAFRRDLVAPNDFASSDVIFVAARAARL